MRGRVLVLAAALVATFWYFTSKADVGLGRLLRPLAETGRLWSSPDSSHASGYAPDELNNIDIYKTAHTATVNITSIVYQRDWFMQLYPSRGIGSGFIINENGQILTNNHVIRDSRAGD